MTTLGTNHRFHSLPPFISHSFLYPPYIIFWSMPTSIVAVTIMMACTYPYFPLPFPSLQSTS